MPCTGLLNRRSWCLPALVVAGSLVSPLFIPRAAAGIGGCAGDPIVVLSNGDSLDLNTVVTTADGRVLTHSDGSLLSSSSPVQQIVYTLRVPIGVIAVSTMSFGPQE